MSEAVGLFTGRGRWCSKMGPSQPLGRKWKHTQGLSGHRDYALEMHSVLSEADSLGAQLGKRFHQVDVGDALPVMFSVLVCQYTGTLNP